MTGGFDDSRDPDLEAAEYVLGTLDADERTAFAERLKRDSAAGYAVAGWEARFAGLGARLDPVMPPSQVWERIERAISAGTGGAAIPFKVIAGGGRQAPDTNGLKRSRNRWRTGALLSGAVAAALLVALTDRVLRATPAPGEEGATYVAAVNRGGNKPALIVRVNTKTGQVLVRPVDAMAPAGHSLELWYIGDDKTPRSMGVVDRGTMRLKLPEAAENATFAITVEPPGGSKSGAPTGAPVYSGQLVKE